MQNISHFTIIQVTSAESIFHLVSVDLNSCQFKWLKSQLRTLKPYLYTINCWLSHTIEWVLLLLILYVSSSSFFKECLKSAIASKKNLDRRKLERYDFMKATYSLSN